jgi:SAM-dependent methyltransferase
VLEPGVVGARNARSRGIRGVVCATLEQAAFAPGSFGATGLFDVVEHVEDDVGLLRSIHQVLRPGGIVCVTVPAYEWLWSAEDEHAGHFRRYTLASIRRVLERASFAVQYETYLFAPLVAPIFVLRSLRHRLFGEPPSTKDASAAREHDPSPRARALMERLLAPEPRLIREGRTIPVGTSCLVVAAAT